MIESAFILNILDLLLDGDEEGRALRGQIGYLTDVEYEYTGSGLFVTFEVSDGAGQERYQGENVLLDGVAVTSSQLGLGASASVLIKDGLIHTLEIWSYDGVYPQEELEDYTLRQLGSFGSGREISV